jgi:cobalt/nickel transport system permease protein
VIRLLAMHAPDGLFSMPVNIAFGGVVAVMLAMSVVALRRARDHRLVPLMGIMAAFVFAGQMVNFPIAAGITGHLLGGTLAAIVLGPWAGSIVMATVVMFQALLGDGGLTVLGPNVFNMGMVGTCLAYFIYRAARGRSSSPARIVGAAFFAAWSAVVLASVFVSLQLAVSGTVSLARTFPVMVYTHMAIGVGEGLITAAIVAFVLRTRPELIQRQAPGTSSLGWRVVGGGVCVSLVVAVSLSLLPTLWDHPDGLEYVGFEQGFVLEEAEQAEGGALRTLPAYPLGVRLCGDADRVRVAHVYDASGSPFAVGDAITHIHGKPTATLDRVADELGYDVQSGAFSVEPETPIAVTVVSGGSPVEATVHALASPMAGSEGPAIALMPDYTVPGVDGLFSTSLAGAIGTLVMLGASIGIGRLLVRPNQLLRAAAERSHG